MMLQSYKVLVPFPHQGQMVKEGVVQLSPKQACHLLAGGKVALSKSKTKSKKGK
ncbi:hypothetical protein [Alteromonas sp. a30]|uniref:hypothetical protein n=1 Tax=Alteromonas sp. a30 TaxID=2730917 RepID=UPI0022828007|nr:hypothetical protein [Alteromonas sp. a30]MCY7295094.1 hypothetical protein [Alteromonas sp. a30]